MNDSFQVSGFLSVEAQDHFTRNIRHDASAWFHLAEESSLALTKLAHAAMDQVQTSSMEPRAIGVRVLLRCVGHLQGSILLVERGMNAESRTLIRCMLEGAFTLAALLREPTEVVKILRDDAEKSRRMQAKYIRSQGLINAGTAMDKLEELIKKSDRPEFMSPKDMSSKGVLSAWYLKYQRLSDDSAHLTARSLNRHVKKSGHCWQYRWGPGSIEENSATLHEAVNIAIGIGLGASELIGDTSVVAELSKLAELCAGRPDVEVI